MTLVLPDQPPAPDAPGLILLVGMHRSGTSLLGSLLPALGVAVPGELLEADRHNPAGYWERRDVTDLQERLLIDLGRWWPGATGAMPLPDQWLQSPFTRRAGQQLSKILRQEGATQNGPWAIKDPRSSLLLPLWRQVCSEIGMPLRLVHAVRDPAEVMLSLLRRDADTAGMTPIRAQQLWWHHNTRILQDGGDLPRLVVHYSRWFEPGAEQQLDQLSQFCAGRTPHTAAKQAALAQINPAHRRSKQRKPLPRPIHRRLRQLERALIGEEHPKTGEEQRRIPPAPRWRDQPPLPPPGPLPRLCRLEVVGYGATPCHWSVHAWLQRCPLPKGFQLSDDPRAPAVGLHLQPVELTERAGALRILRRYPMVLDPRPERVEQLRERGIRAFWLDAGAANNGWLENHFVAAAASQLFGLPDPKLLRQHGKVISLGSSGEPWERSLRPTVWCLPRFNDLYVPDADAARLLAGWLNTCQRSGLQLVRLQPTTYEQESLVFTALDQPDETTEDWLPPLLLSEATGPEEIETELAWRRSGQRTAQPIHTPQPLYDVVWERGSPGARVAICISLYNYADRVLAALDSAKRQTLHPIEVIICDDASSDNGASLVVTWLNQHGHHFQRALLVRHHHNSGLAAARNTAFSLTEADWCFVLDADNSLEPEAAALCLAVADTSPPTTAVVHPLVEIRSPDNHASQSEPVLLTQISWQSEQLLTGNQIDAMALIRRKHWQKVGGYTHIAGGWEDYDFWCKLIEAGLHGVLCPQRLAIYNQHASSMQASETRRRTNELKRSLQARHPWLELTTSHG